ncbi:hypothetical protein [Halalkalibacter okhensis]|uniref:Uncharacterized protein n=1 Tax=Halalkalibacter okhensis TaxID=333138 RepID=A0A0B0IKY6_9BACI|nr:hypothetical protein [Halalkalibacter okhensis]KHF40724.1 hypothetical protein LQ50_08025 [Halalkalibacter okhensis]
MPYKNTNFTLLHNQQEIPISHYHYGFEHFFEDNVRFTYKGVKVDHGYKPKDDTPDSAAIKLCKTIDHGGKDSLFKFDQLYSELKWLRYRYIILGGKVYNHDETIPHVRKKHIYAVEFKNGKIVRNISNSRFLNGDDEMIIRSVRLSLRSVEHRAREWHKKTGSLPRDKHIEIEHTEKLQEIHKFFEEIGIKMNKDGGIE